MSRDSAKAHYTKQPGDPDEGFITASDAQAAIDDIYDDMSAPAVIADGSVTSGKIAADAVGSAQIATGAVGSGELATDAVTSDKIADGAVSNAHVASDAAIAASKVAGTAVTQADTGTVTNGMLAGSIAKTKVAGTAITAADTGTVTGTMIGTGEVGNGNLAANAVNEAKIASGAVTTVKIEDDAVTAAKIAANAVGSSELADNAVDTASIQDHAVTVDKIAPDAASNGLVLTSDDGEDSGMKWSAYGVADLDIGTVSTGTPAAASMTGNPEDGYELNLTLPPVGDGSVAPAALTWRIGNLLSENAASGTDTLGDTTGFVAAAGCTFASSTTQAAQGSRSLKYTSTAGGTLSGSVVAPVEEGKTYTATAQARAGSTSRPVHIYITWVTAADGYISAVDVTGAVTSTSADWVTLQGTVVAPATAAKAVVEMYVDASAAGEAHYWDCIGMWEGTGGQWAMPGYPILGLTDGTLYLADDVAGLSAAVADAVAELGNLLTDNQATAGDTLGTVVGVAESIAIVTVETGITAAQGSKCFKVTATGASAGMLVCQDVAAQYYVPVTPGERYTFTAWMKSDTITRNATLQVMWRAADGSGVSTTYGNRWQALTSDWAEYTFTGVAPANAKLAIPEIVCQGSLAGEVYFVDKLGFWAGVGGRWVAPGRPVPEVGAVWHIACALRNGGAPNYWQPLDDTDHTPIGVTHCETVDGKIRLYYARGASEVGSLVVTGDESLAGTCNCGASVGMAYSDIWLKDPTTGANRDPLTTGLGAGDNLWVMGVMR